MSAIAGVFELPTNETIIGQMAKTMERRGSQQYRFYAQAGKTLICADCKTDLQPYVMDWAGERYVLCCDANLFNREQIRQQLQHLGHELKDDCDEELILRSFICWGDKTPEKLNGSFAIMILCCREKRVFLARDRMGVKPLFYMEKDGGLLVASEMKTILSYPMVEAEIDVQGAGEILLLGPGRTPGSGVFYGMKELKPGHCGVFSGGNLQLRPYWQLRDREHTDSFEETAEKVRYLIKDSVIRQMNTDDTVGTMLSGGLDSGIVSALCAKELERRGKKLDTFSVDYQDNEKYFVSNGFQPDTDTEYVQIMQQFLNSNHHQTILSPEELVDGIADATIARDLPGMADVDISLLAFCKQIRPWTATVLSGECADEIFGGYPWYRDPRMRDVDTFPWAQSTKERAALLQDWILQELQPVEFVHSRYDDTVSHADILPDCSATDRRIKELVNLNFQWFMQTLIDRGDRMGAYCGLDIRMPFCDYRIAEYLYGVPWSYKDFNGREKGLLRHSMEGVLPERVLYRKKSPYPKTYDPRYLKIVSEMLQNLLQDRNAPIFNLVRREPLEELLHQDFAWPWYGQLMRRPQTIVYMLQINYWMEHYSVRIR